MTEPQFEIYHVSHEGEGWGRYPFPAYSPGDAAAVYLCLHRIWFVPREDGLQVIRLIVECPDGSIVRYAIDSTQTTQRLVARIGGAQE